MPADRTPEEQLFDLLLSEEATATPMPNAAVASSSSDDQDTEEALFDALFESESPAGQGAPIPPAHDSALSKLQERLWLVQQLEPTSRAYVIPFHLRLRGPLDPKHLKAAFHQLWQRHESLRTIFPLVRGQPQRSLLSPDALVLVEHDFTKAKDDEAWRQHYMDHHAAPMLLDTGPLFKVCIYRLAPEHHVILIDLHHINGDGTSLDILREELFTLYTALREGRPPQLPPIDVTYSDYVAAESERHASARHRDQWEAHLESLVGAPTLIDFHFDHPSVDKFNYTGDVVLRDDIDPDLPPRIEQIARKLGVSPFTVYLAAFGSVLHLQSQQEDFLVGIPLSQRMAGGFDHTVGFLVNTGVARLAFSGQPTLRKIMLRTAKSVRKMLGCPDAPLEHIARALHDRRIPNRSPLIQATFSYHQSPTTASACPPELSIKPCYVLRRGAMFELTLDLMVQGSQSMCGLEYYVNTWEAPTAKRLLDQFFLILTAMIEQPDARLDEIDLLPDEQHALIAGALEGEALPAPSAIVPDLLRDYALSHPVRPAILCGDGETSHGQLLDLISHRRGQLNALGLKRGAVLALASAPGLDWAVTALAALAESVVVLPIDPQTPVARLRYVLDNANAALLWHDEAFNAAEARQVIRCTLASAATAPTATPIAEAARAQPADIAYLIYTSGTTGQPKGVRVSHAAFAAHGLSALHAYGMNENDRTLVFSPMHFDAAWDQLFVPLLAGGSVLIRDGQLWAPDELCAQLTRHRVTCADLPPQYLRELLFHFENIKEHPPETLRLVLAGGEAMPTELAQAWLAGPLGHVPLVNVYGPTEAVITSLCNPIDAKTRIVTPQGIVPIGRPLPGRVIRILDPEGREVGAGLSGELCLGGPSLAEGYQGDDARTAKAFRHWLRTSSGSRWVDAGTPGAIRLYRSGDRVRLGPDDRIEFLGRIDRQIKIRGFRIEPGEVEAILIQHDAIAQALVTSQETSGQGDRLVAYCLSAGTTPPPSTDELTTWLARWLPEHMVPGSIQFLSQFPIGTNGKIDLTALPPPDAPVAARKPAAVAADPENSEEARITALWSDVLGRTDISRTDNFFDLGGHSLLLVRVHTRLCAEFDIKLPLVELFAHPTVASLAAKLRGETATPARSTRRAQPARSNDIAVIGMSGRFPGAANIDELWANLAAGHESIRFFTPEELAAAGIPAAQREQPNYVPAHGHLEGSTEFDAGFFGYTPKEAEIIDPQQRLFLEESWHALEHAGCDPDRHAGDIGVFAGIGMNLYLLGNLGDALRKGRETEAYAISLANDKDFVASRVSYKLNLRGPGVNINTACSTSLVAIHMAAEALLRDECDMALAGGVTLQLPPKSGYIYQPGAIASPDGHCRAFADDATGTVGGSGVVVVALKRLDQAMADGNTIHAVIKGSAINNDGADKVGFTAPGVNRQRDVIRKALDRAGINASGLQYIEAHGTGTPMGDPIEVQALTNAFAPDHPPLQSCYLGSIKSNIGHLDTAAGAAGFVKTVLALRHGQIPPTLHCEHPSKKIGFENTPFRIAQKLTPWPDGERRRAGVSSFGIGGTNAHVILEEAPAPGANTPLRQATWCLPVSARSPRSLLASARQLARHLETHPDTDAEDLWFTLSEGRRRHPVRAVLLADSCAAAIKALDQLTEAELLRTDRDGKVLSGTGDPQAAAFASHEGFTAARDFAREWLTGDQAAASAELPAGFHRRLPLPTYVFDHEEYWIGAPTEEPAAPAISNDKPNKLPPADWYYFPSWERIPTRRAPSSIANTPLLIMHQGSAAEQRWLDALRAANWNFTACTGGPELESALGPLATGENWPAECWHLTALGHAPGETADYARRLDALLADLRVLATATQQRPLRLTLFCPHAGGPDSPLDPAFAYLDAVCTVVPHEYRAITAHTLRIDPAINDTPALLSARATTIDGPAPLALISGKLWHQTFAHLPVDAPKSGAVRLRARGTYLITGGLGGIGLTLARHLAQTFQARLVLISRREPDESQRKLIHEMESAGAEVRTAALDLADGSALRILVDDAVARWGSIDGVIHAAGVGGGSLIAHTQLDEIERVLHAKVVGTVALAEALRGRQPEFVLLCSSLTAALGGPGQVAYAAANAWMDAFAATQSVAQPGRWISVQWDSWAEVGMAARALSGPRPVAPAQKLLREWTLSPDTYWPWGEHRVDGVAMLPGTGYLDLFAQALDSAFPLEIDAVALKEPMILAGSRQRTVRVSLEGDELILQSDDGSEPHEHARARLAETPPAQPSDLIPLAEIEARCSATDPTALSAPAAGITIDAGPRWQIDGTYWHGHDEALARLVLPEQFTDDLTTHPLHPALLDLALSYYIAYVEGGAGVLPWRYEKVRVFAPLTSRLTSHLRLRSRNERALVLDANLYDEHGRLLMQVEGYTLLQVDPQAAPSSAPRPKPRAAVGNPFALTPAEGIDALLRCLGTAEPVVCLSTVDWKFATNLSPAVSAAPPEDSTASVAGSNRKPRPEITTPYREPQAEAEKIMAGVWAEVLGYDRLGLDDDLFDLGADSLTALQASARLKELTGHELPMERFFAEPTILHLADGLPLPSGAAKGASHSGAESWEEGEL